MIYTNNDERTFKTLRLSLTNDCNLACSYCVKEVSKKIKNSQLKALTVEELTKIIFQLHHTLDLETIRLTGGEPTLYANIIPLIEQLIPFGVKIKLTTNGFLLKNLLQKLPYKVFDSINVSVDALDEELFFKISKRRGLSKILEGIALAKAQNIDLKINTVVMRNANISQIIPLLDYGFENKIPIRFLELMKMGHVHTGDFSEFFSQAEILEVIKSKFEITKSKRKTSSTANYWQTNKGAVFGIIANESEPFCSDCNRLRLDSFGNIYGCLSSNEPILIKDLIANDILLKQKLDMAMAQKQKTKFVGSSLSMLDIGG